MEEQQSALTMPPNVMRFAKSDTSQTISLSAPLSDGEVDESATASDWFPAAFSRRVRGFVRSVDHGTLTVMNLRCKARTSARWELA